MSDSYGSCVVLVTGCSSGFGLQTAAYLAGRGYQVIATMRCAEKKSALLSELQRKGGAVEIVELDVTDPGSIKKAVRQVASRYGHIDILVNNAGRGIGGFFEDMTDQDMREIMEVNFFGVLNVTREALMLMRPRRQGKIINISSVSGFSASPAFSAYNASKWALEGFTESLRYELGPFGIDVLLVEPGSYRTEIFSGNVQYAQNFDNPKSPYFRYSQHLKEKVMGYIADCHKDIDEVPALVEKLIRSKNPSFRNLPDIEAKTMYILRHILPFSVYSWIIRKALYGGFKPGS